MTEPLDLATNYTGGDYIYKMGGNGSTVVNGKKQIDCSHMVNLLLTGAGYSIPYEDTRVMENSTYYTTVLPQDVKRGDIALWINATPNSPGAPLFHTGIVQEFNAANRSGYIFGAQTSTGPARARFGPKPPSFFWPVATKFLRAKEEFRTGGAAPAPEAPAATPAPAGPAPLMNFQYPFRKADGKQFTDAEEIYKALEGETAGHYLLGSNRFWHGGIHISDQSAPQCVLNEPIRCMADGEVVAYRLNEDYLESTFGDNEKKLKYSNSFCLVRHEYKSAPNPEEGANKGKQNKLTFYSLYMHLLPFARYPLSPAETPKPKVTMKVGDFRAYDTAPAPGVTTASCGQLAIGTKLEIIETAENGELTYAKGKILSGSVKQGATKKRVEGAEVWFAYLKNGEPYKNSVPKRIWLADDVPERARPNYWQGKVKASVVNKLPLYDDPASPTNGQPAGARKGTLELVMNSVIEFNSSEVVNLALDGKLHRMAKCTMLSGGLRGHGAVPPSFWACVENDPANKVLKWDSVTPTSFDTVVMTSTGVKAGDPIGYLGQTENLTGENGGVSSKYQVHVEIFTADAEVKDFLKNTAGLKIGKQYLHLASGAVLKQKAPATGTTALKQDHAVDLAKATIVKEGTDDWYEVSVIEDDQPVAGLIKKATALVITQHDWEKLGFQIVEENNAAADGFLDPDAMPQFFKDLFAKIDKNHDGEVEPAELAEALKKPETRTQWARLVAHHPTEWKDKAGSPKWSKLDKLLETSPKMLKHEKERIDKYVFWDELSGKAKMTSSLIWHFHPVEFISTFSAKKVCACNAIVKATRWVSSSKTHYGPLHTGDKELGSAPQWDDLVSEGKITEEEKKIIVVMSGNEAKINGVQSYDSEIITAGAMQKTINLSGGGELPLQVKKFKNQHPEAYIEYFDSQGWKLDETGDSAKMYYQGPARASGAKLEGKALKDNLKIGCSESTFGKVVDCQPVSVMACA
ncbi:EF-hand domain-containing protein, partial [Pseudomonas syringae group genomosp. 3]